MKSTLALAVALALIVASPFALLFGAQFCASLLPVPALACLTVAGCLVRFAERASLIELGIAL